MSTTVSRRPVAHRPPLAEGRTTIALRRGLLALAAAGLVGTTIELATLRHWGSVVQLVPWFALAGLAVPLAAVAARPTRTALRWARGVAVVVMVVAAFGIFEHVAANDDDGARKGRARARWAAMSTTSRWWAAASGGAGGAPPLAPAVLAQTAACLGLATVGHPAGRQNGRTDG